MDGRATQRLRFNHNGATHQPNALPHADETKNLDLALPFPSRNLFLNQITDDEMNLA
jgi:hypothetical protein